MVWLQRVSSFLHRRPLISIYGQARNASKEVVATESKDGGEFWSVRGDADEDEASMLEEMEAKIEMKRNKSRLRREHRNILNQAVPFDESQYQHEYQMTDRYKRRLFGRYGNSSGVDPATLWPSQSKIQETLAHENIAHPLSIQQMIDQALEAKRQEEQKINEKMERISKSILKIEQWKQEVHDRATKKLAEVNAAKAKKDALIEEVRRHFGYKIDPKDDRFKEMLLQKEKAYKKKAKEERAKAKQEKLYAKFIKNEK